MTNQIHLRQIISPVIGWTASCRESNHKYWSAFIRVGERDMISRENMSIMQFVVMKMAYKRQKAPQHLSAAKLQLMKKCNNIMSYRLTG